MAVLPQDANVDTYLADAVALQLRLLRDDSMLLEIPDSGDPILHLTRDEEVGLADLAPIGAGASGYVAPGSSYYPSPWGYWSPFYGRPMYWDYVRPWYYDPPRTVVIDRPIIVGGLPRSGTTHLVGLLGAAVLLSEEKELPAPVRLIFQPAEEKGTGAQAMIQAGALDGAGLIFGGHLDRHYQPGTIVVSEGAVPKDGTMELVSGEKDAFGHVRLRGEIRVCRWRGEILDDDFAGLFQRLPKVRRAPRREPLGACEDVRAAAQVARGHAAGGVEQHGDLRRLLALDAPHHRPAADQAEDHARRGDRRRRICLFAPIPGAPRQWG